MYKNIISSFPLQTALLFCLLLVSGCKFTKGVNSMLSKKVKPIYYTYEDKTIIFTPLVHFGQKEFYENLRTALVDWKKDGYTIFYESIGSGQSYLGLDSISYDKLQREFRRINGGNATAEDYAEDLQKVFKKGVSQPVYKDLGIDSTDLNVDVSLVDLINKFEELYSEIKLDSCDYATHLDSSYSCSKGLKMKKLEPVYVDYRNTAVVEKIIKSDFNKMVVLYGAAHIKGMKKLLKEE